MKTIGRFLLALLGASIVRAAPAPASFATPLDEVTAAFRPYRTDRAALSPDGHYLAYSVREGTSLAVWVVEVDHPAVNTVRVTVATDATSTPMLTNAREKTPARILWMEWVTPTRLVVETNRSYAFATGNAWSSCPNVIVAFDPDGRHARTLVTPQDVAEWTANSGALPPASNNPSLVPTPPATGTSPELAPATRPRSPNAWDYVPGKPDSLLVLTDGIARPDGETAYGRYRVNVDTGAVHFLGDELVDANQRPYFDRQGRLRLTLPDSARIPFPHRFVYETAGGFTGRKTLDQVAGLKTGPGFSVSPADFFGERAVPVGFDDNPEILFYASNLGRDTYGIYRLDLKTGRSRFETADPTYDLIGPLPEIPSIESTLAINPGDDQSAAAPTMTGAVAQPDNPALGTFAAATGLGGGASGQPASNAASGPLGGTSVSSLAGGTATSVPIPTPVAPETPLPSRSDVLVRDPYTRQLIGIRYQGKLDTTRWLEPAWQQVQDELEAALPGKSVRIEEWDRSGRRFLVLAYGPADPGAFYVFDRQTNHLSEFVRRAPWLAAEKAHRVMDFSFANPAGGRITGTITFPDFFRIKPVPLVVLCPPTPWARVPAGYEPEAQALADLGFAVVRYDGRGAWGFGRASREAFLTSHERAEVGDLVTLVARLAKEYIIDPRHVALVGSGLGGFLALRAMQLEPDHFRCAVALNAPVDLAAWLKEVHWTSDDVAPALIRAALGSEADLKAAPLVRDPGSVGRPVMLLCYPGEPGQERNLTYLDARNFAAAVRRHGQTVEWVDLDDDFMQGLPAAEAQAFGRIGDFLNANLYDFKVKVGVPVVRGHGTRRPGT